MPEQENQKSVEFIETDSLKQAFFARFPHTNVPVTDAWAFIEPILTAFNIKMVDIQTKNFWTDQRVGAFYDFWTTQNKPPVVNENFFNQMNLFKVKTQSHEPKH